MTELLEAHGFDVRSAPNGLVAFEHLRGGFHPRVILLDLMMPGMDGWDFRAAQLADPLLKDVPTILTSASGFSGETVRGQLGAVVYMHKPTSAVDLLAAVHRLSGRHRPA